MEMLTLSIEKQIRALGSSHGRKKSGKTLIEGVRSLSAMLQRGIMPELVVVAPSELTAQGKALLSEIESRGIRVYQTDHKRMSDFSETEHSQGFVAVASRNSLDASESAWTNARLVVYLDNVSDPGNVGTLIRTCAAFKVDLVALSPTTADITNPKVLRSTAGAIFAQPIALDIEAETLATRMESNKMSLVGMAGDGSIELESYEPAHKVCIALGSEATGLSDAIRSKCDDIISIRSTDLVESLNVAAAGAIAIYRIALKMKLL